MHTFQDRILYSILLNPLRLLLFGTDYGGGIYLKESLLYYKPPPDIGFNFLNHHSPLNYRYIKPIGHFSEYKTVLS